MEAEDIRMSTEMRKTLTDLRSFMFQRVYASPVAEVEILFPAGHFQLFSRIAQKSGVKPPFFQAMVQVRACSIPSG